MTRSRKGADFPPLKTLDVLPNNLPIQLTSFIGREREKAKVRRLLSAIRFLTGILNPPMRMRSRTLCIACPARRDASAREIFAGRSPRKRLSTRWPEQ